MSHKRHHTSEDLNLERRLTVCNHRAVTGCACSVCKELAVNKKRCTFTAVLNLVLTIFLNCLCVASYGRVYTTDPYHALAPAAAAYGVGAMVRTLTQAP